MTDLPPPSPANRVLHDGRWLVHLHDEYGYDPDGRWGLIAWNRWSLEPPPPSTSTTP